VRCLPAPGAWRAADGDRILGPRGTVYGPDHGTVAIAMRGTDSRLIAAAPDLAAVVARLAAASLPESFSGLQDAARAALRRIEEG
jgi:hypothetical protein